MHRLVACLPALLLLAGCGERSTADAVRASYDNKAAAIDAQAARQPTEIARKIYESRADAIREEGKDREKGLEGGEPSSGQGSEAPASNSQ